MTSTTDIVAKLWSLCHVLRDDGVTYNEYVTELTFLLFLKMLEETGKESRLPKQYRWRELAKREGLDQLDYYKRLLLDLGKPGIKDGLVRAIFTDAQTKLRKPTNLKSLTSSIDQLDWFSAREEGLGNLYEGLLEKNASDKKSGAGQYFTPRPLIDCIVRLMKPEAGETIQDPAAGTAGFRGRLTQDFRQSLGNEMGGGRPLSAVRKAHQIKWEEGSKAPFVPHRPIAANEQPFKIPTLWNWVTAEEIVEPGCEIVYGIVQPGPKLASGIPYVRGTDIENGRIKIDQLLFTSKEIADKYSRASLKGGDILLGIIRATKVAIVPDELTGANITQGTARFRPSSAILTPFLARWLESSQAQDWLHSKYRGIDMPGLNLRDVRRLPVPLAPLDEQREIGVRIETAFAWIDRLHSEATSARKLIDHLDQAVLTKALRGALVPQDPGEERAGAVLERIKGRQALAPAKRGKRPRQNSD